MRAGSGVYIAEFDNNGEHYVLFPSTHYRVAIFTYPSDFDSLDKEDKIEFLKKNFKYSPKFPDKHAARIYARGLKLELEENDVILENDIRLLNYFPGIRIPTP